MPAFKAGQRYYHPAHIKKQLSIFFLKLLTFTNQLMNMAANRIVFFLLLPVLLCLYLAWKLDASYAPYMIPFLVTAILAYVLAPQINWWWYQKWPPDLSEGLTRLVERSAPFYKNLPPLEKRRFRARVALFNMNLDWTPIAFPEDELPPDLSTMISIQAATITFWKNDFLFKKFEKVIVYPLPFPSPEYPFPHSSELYEADGCLIFSARELALGCMQPNRYYNIGLHEFARAYIMLHPDANWPLPSEEDIWDQLSHVSGMDRGSIEQTIGLAGIDVLPVMIHHYYIFPDRFRGSLPNYATQLDQLFEKPTAHTI